MNSKSYAKLKEKIENLKNLKNLYIHLRRRILTRGNLLGYEKLSKVRKIWGSRRESQRKKEN